MSFDPDAYLSSGVKSGFDPDAYLASNKASNAVVSDPATEAFNAKLKAIDERQRIPVKEDNSILGKLGDLWNSSQLQDAVNRFTENNVTLPTAPDLSNSRLGRMPIVGPVPGLIGLSPSDLAAGYNSMVKPLAESLTSPLGVATLGLGSAPRAIRTAAEAGFAGLMGKDTYEGIKNAIDVGNNPLATDQQKLESKLGPIGTGAMALGAGAAAAHGLSTPGASVKIETPEGHIVKVDTPEKPQALPVSEVTRQRLIDLGYTDVAIGSTNEVEAQKALNSVDKSNRQAQDYQLKQQKAAQDEIKSQQEEALAQAQGNQPKQETPPEVTQAIQDIKTKAKDQSGQSVTEMLAPATTKVDAVASLNSANEVATKTPGAQMPQVDTTAPKPIENALNGKQSSPDGLSYDETVKGKQTNYQKTLKELGVTEAQVRAQTENTSDQIPMPLGEGAKIVVGPSKIEGNGILTTQEVPKGEVLAPALIDGNRTPAGRYTNHSGKPNAEMVVRDDGRVDLVAKKNLNPNEEVTINYKQARSAAIEAKGIMDKIKSVQTAVESPKGTIQKVSSMTPDEIFSWSRTLPDGGLTKEAYRIGISAIDNESVLNSLKDAHEKAKKDSADIEKRAKVASDEEFKSISKDWPAISSKEQFFSEAIQAAEHKGSAVGDPQVEAAHAKIGKEIAPQKIADANAQLVNPEPAPAPRQKPINVIDLPKEPQVDQSIGSDVYNQLLAKIDELDKRISENIAAEQPPLNQPTPREVSTLTDKLEYLKQEYGARNLTKEEFNQQTQEAINQNVPLSALVSDEKLVKLDNDNEVKGIVDLAKSPPPPVPPDFSINAGGSSEGNNRYIQGLTKLPLGVGKAFELVKYLIGTVQGNLRDTSPVVFGGLKIYEYQRAKLLMDFANQSIAASRLTRKVFSKAGHDEFGRLLLSGQEQAARDLANNHTRYGPQIGSVLDSARQALDQAQKLLIESRGPENVGYVENFWPREFVKDGYNKLRTIIGLKEEGVLDAAIRQAEKSKRESLTDEEKAVLTPDEIAQRTTLTNAEKEKLINGIIDGSSRNGGKPGFLKQRTIETIQKKWGSIYQPFDVALENYFRKVSNDVVNRKWFGKSISDDEGSSYNPTLGNFGKLLRQEIENGNLTPAAQKIVVDNLRDRFKTEKKAADILDQVGDKIRKATTAAFLGQLTTGIGQFADVLGTSVLFGPYDTARGFIKPLGLDKIGVHEGQIETNVFSHDKTLLSKGTDLVIKYSLGIYDQFMKSGQGGAIIQHYADIFDNPKSAQFNVINKVYSRQFPEMWPRIKAELMKPDFRARKFNELTRFFVNNELSNIQPLNASQMSQFYNASKPLGKSFLALKSFMVNQLDILRSKGYENIKNADGSKDVADGLAFLAAYSMIVGAGANFGVSYVRDKILNRNTSTADYFLGGMLQLVGLSRYSIMQMRQGNYGNAIIELISPFASLVKELSHDSGLLVDMNPARPRRDSGGVRTVNGIGDLFSKSELIKHTPFVGSLLYSRLGAGATREKQNQIKASKGMPQPTTVDAIETMFFPQDKKTPNRN